MILIKIDPILSAQLSRDYAIDERHCMRALFGVPINKATVRSCRLIGRSHVYRDIVRLQNMQAEPLAREHSPFVGNPQEP